jgi:ComEC/Rec2-related protein
VGWFEVVWLLVMSLLAGIARRPGAGLAVACVTAVWSLRRCAPLPQTTALALLAVACLAYGACTMERLDHQRAAFDAVFSPGHTVEFTGTVTGFPRSGRHGTTFRFRGATRHRGGTVSLDMLVRAARFDVHFRERIRMAVRAVETPRGPRSLFAEGCVGVVRVSARDYQTLAVKHAVGSWPWRIHRGMRTTLSRRLGADGGLPLALLLGERGAIRQETRRGFARLGISHLLALSGMHLGLMAGLVWFALRGLGVPPRWSDVAVAVFIGGYVTVVGDVQSLRRAYAMALVLVAGRVVERPNEALGALARALFVLLALRPPSIFSVGFQLSFVAAAAVILSLRIAPRRAQRGARRILAGAATTALAGVFVLLVAAPLQMHHFGQASLMSPLATVLFLPAVALVICGSALACALDRVPLAGDIAFAGLHGLARYLEAMVVRLAEAAPAPAAFPAPDTIVYAAGLGLLLVARRHPLGVLAGLVAVAASFSKNCGL